jgi:hypothetical protein
MPSWSPIWTVWVSLCVTLGIGAGIGYGAQRWSRIGVLFIGGWVGAFVGMLLYNAVIYIFSESNPLLGIWLSILFCATIFAVLSMIFFDQAVVVGSSIAGSYLFVRGFSLYAGGFPNEFVLYEDY